MAARTSMGRCSRSPPTALKFIASSTLPRGGYSSSERPLRRPSDHWLAPSRELHASAGRLPAISLPKAAALIRLNVTVVPQGPLGYLTIWPTGQDQPLVSTLNSLDGRIKANAAIVPAGTPAARSASLSPTPPMSCSTSMATSTAAGSSTLQFYPLTPCRVADTRNAHRRRWAGRT